MITFDAVFAAGIHENSSSFDVCVQENLRVFDGAVYMAFSGEIHHHIRMFFLKQPVYGFTVCNAFFYKTEIGIIHNRCKCGKISCVGQAVQTDDTIVRVFF